MMVTSRIHGITHVMVVAPHVVIAQLELMGPVLIVDQVRFSWPTLQASIAYPHVQFIITINLELTAWIAIVLVKLAMELTLIAV